MRNTMDVSYQTRMNRENFYSYKTQKNQESTKDFQETKVEKSEEKEQADRVFQASVVSTKDMTLEEYKKYIYDRISMLPIHPSNRNDFIAVQISDAGFRAMQADPEYEQWVLDTLQKDFMYCDPFSSRYGGKCVIHSFGAAKETYRAESWRMDEPNREKYYNKKAENSFWERRAKRRKQLKEEYERLLKKRFYEKKLYEKYIYEKKLQQKKYEAKVGKGKAEEKQQMQKQNQSIRRQALGIYEESSVVEDMEFVDFMG